MLPMECSSAMVNRREHGLTQAACSPAQADGAVYGGHRLVVVKEVLDDSGHRTHGCRLAAAGRRGDDP